MTFERDIIP